MRLQKQFSFKSDQQYQQLVDLARNHGFKSVSGFVQAIAASEIPLEVQATSLEQQALVKAVSLLQASGDVSATKVVAKLLIERGLLNPTLRSSIDGSFAPLFALWLVQLEEYVNQKRSFQLSYQDAAGRSWTYTVRYAQISFREKRNYLECWCEQTQGNQDLPQLHHNWTLRLDRIIDAGIVPIDGEWRSGLDEIEVEFQLFGNLAHAYAQRDLDVAVEWLSVEPPIKQVSRRMNNTFWFIREILPYGKDCVVLEPEAIRHKVKTHLEAACKLYESK